MSTESDVRYWVVVKVVRYDDHSQSGIVKPEFWDRDRDVAMRHIEQRKDQSLILYPESWGKEPDLGDEWGGERRVTRAHEEMCPKLKELVDWIYKVHLRDKSFFPEAGQEDRPLPKEDSWDAPKQNDELSPQANRHRRSIKPGF